MKKLFFFLSAWTLTWTATAQMTEWQDPAVPQWGREIPVTGFISYAAREQAARNTPSPYYKSLDGTWKYRRFASIRQLSNEVFQPQYDVSGWEEVTVPQKGDKDQHREKTFEISTDTPANLFRTTFHMPFAWADKQVFVELEAGSGVYVFVNGQKAGYAEDSGAPAAFDITTLIREGNNSLVVAATDVSTGSRLEFDGPTQGTITGPVVIKTLPKLRVRDFEVRTELTEGYRNGVLDFGVIVKTHQLNRKEATVYFELFSPDGQLLRSDSRPVALDMRGEQTIHFEALVPDVKPWSAESPTLYTVTTRIQHEGRYTETIERKVGFRSVESIDGELRINGKLFMPSELNLVDFPTDSAGMEQAFQRMKNSENYHNALRPIHGLLPERFYELCDRYGYYVISEANIDSRASGTLPESSLANHPAYLDAHLDRVETAWLRTRNHPSVIAFSLGNGGNGYNLYEAYLRLKSQETTRPVIYAGARQEWNTDRIDYIYNKPID
jgi:beta-galactosidase